MSEGTNPTAYVRSSRFEFNFRTVTGDAEPKTLVLPDLAEIPMGISADGGTVYSYFATHDFADSVPFEYGPVGMHIDDLHFLDFKFGTPAIFWEMSVF